MYPGNFYPENSSSFCGIRDILSNIFDRRACSLWRSLFVIFIEIKYRESFHRIPEFHFERFSVIFFFFSTPYLSAIFHRISFRKFLTIINYPYLSPVTQSFLKIPGYPVLTIHVFSSDTFERYFLTFFTQVIPIEITYRRIRSIGDSRRSTGGSRPTRWDSVSTMHFSRSPRPLVHTKGIRNCCCYVAPRGGHL